MTSKLQAAYSNTGHKGPLPKEEVEDMGHYCDACGSDLSAKPPVEEIEAEEEEILDEATKAALFAKALKEKKP